ncbi:hypothetical protein [Nonomuraea lactucae]|uniref:Rv1733c family protein n=1 Tax=Nonomuraea lactucae TaxID=2249762 RepID=UPI0013B35A40|nr:hypothetical protein [Nonomuraea lactucae]
MTLRVRRYRFDRNPLRRRSDRLETVGVLVALALFLLSVWPAAVAGRLVHEGGLYSERTGPGIRQPTTATLVRDAPGSGSIGETRAVAQWVTPAGRLTSERVAAPAGAKAGTPVIVWLDGQGEVTRPPTCRAETLAGAITMGVLVMAGSAAVLITGVRGFRRLLDRSRQAAWETSWVRACDR